MDRRHFLTGAPVAVAAIGAGAVTALSPALAEAMEKHRAAQAIVDDAIADGWGSWRGDIPDEPVDAEAAAFAALAITPCVSDAEFAAKARYMIKHQRKLWLTHWKDYSQAVLTALDLHMNGPEAAELERV